MDVAKYIGLFLLKNEQCYVHGLGTLQLLRKAATHDGQQLHAASNEINIVPGGNVDDSLANFIATNEQTSITKASNALKEFSTDTKNRLQAGDMVPLPYLGKFTAEDGRVGFITAPHLQFKGPAIAAKKGISMQHNERPAIPHQPYVPKNTDQEAPAAPAGGKPVGGYMPQSDGERKERVNWARILFVILLLAALAGGAYYGYKRYFEPGARKTAAPRLTIPESMEDEEEDEPIEEQNMMPADTFDNTTGMEQNPATQTAEPDNSPAAADANMQPGNNNTQPAAQQQSENTTPQKPQGRMLNLKIVVNTFDKKQTAYNRKKALNNQGTNAEVIEEDVNYFFVVIPVQASPRDTARLIDSMSRKFNPDSGVFIY